MRRQHAHLLAGHGNWQLVGEFTEVESGKRSDRPARRCATGGDSQIDHCAPFLPIGREIQQPMKAKNKLLLLNLTQALRQTA